MTTIEKAMKTIEEIAAEVSEKSEGDGAGWLQPAYERGFSDGASLVRDKIVEFLDSLNTMFLEYDLLKKEWEEEQKIKAL